VGRRLLLMAGENLIFNINENSPRAPFVVRGCVFLNFQYFVTLRSTVEPACKVSVLSNEN